MLKRSLVGDSVKVTFALPIDQIDQPVSVVGDFNGWDPLVHPLKKRSNGTRSVTVALHEGESFRFKYLADDGSWLCEPDADDMVGNEYGETDSLIRC